MEEVFETYDAFVRAMEDRAKGLMRQGKRVINFMPKREHWPLLEYFTKLEAIHDGFARAAEEVTAFTKSPICVENCGLCCTHASVFGKGVEAEYISAYLLGRPEKLKPVLDRIEGWLTSTSKQWTYGEIKPGAYTMQIEHEVEVACTERCPFLEEDLRCGIHEARPIVCRAYGVTHLPDGYCRRPIGIGESVDSRAHWDADDPRIPLRAMVEDLNASVQEPKYNREGFIATMVYERFRAKTLAGLVADGKAPLAKLAVGWMGRRALLWQGDLNTRWDMEATDIAIGDSVPLVEINGLPAMRGGAK